MNLIHKPSEITTRLFLCCLLFSKVQVVCWQKEEDGHLPSIRSFGDDDTDDDL